ncbi:hypothetical protein GGI26_005590 [Coemansia sp. RSA 1358]|uniref:Hyaluronan-mediated motility receptor C-terminal domain-containing protein n=1 Tax=Coemansia umbellata TaxID=1424467 RepID=A0ABQ8PIQ9_9FUNG|nr:hypothetical protein EDC05_005282 [Coemansia umbellata]KAJ2619736.1 hypothetical protein GGI26_005590 [Coemansia sp. RSA 1358]
MTANTDIPPPGAYDVYSPENPYKRYGFLTKDERFKYPKSDEVASYAETDSTAHSTSRTGSSQATYRRPTVGSSTINAIRAEESRLKREIEHYHRLLTQQQQDASKEVQRLNDKIRMTEDKAKELLRERSELKQRLLKRESDLRAKEKERELLAERLEKQQLSSAPAHPKTEKTLKELSEFANTMNPKLKAALDHSRRTNEEDKRRIRQLEQKIRKLDQEKEDVETQFRQMGEQDYPRQLKSAERELRIQEEQYRESVRKLQVSLQEAKDKATRYMNELGEATVHNTALENELQLVSEREQDKVADYNKQLETAMDKLTMTEARLADLERLSKQRVEESERMLKAANGHIAELKSEIERLEAEREEIQREMKGKIRELMNDYKTAKREFESSVKGADDDRSKRLADSQLRLERATKECLDLKTEISELRSVLLKKEISWKDKKLELEGDLRAAASDYEALQNQMVDQEKRFDEHLRGLEEKARKKEKAWNHERIGIIEKLDAAHKEGFKLRDELDNLQKETAQVKADCEADLKHMKFELDEALASAESHMAKWEEERRELVSAHADEAAGMKEEYDILEQRLHDDRFSLENQLQDARDEIEALQDAHDVEMVARNSQVAKAEEELERAVQTLQRLEEELAEEKTRYSTQVEDIRASFKEEQLESQNTVSLLQDELHAAQQRVEEAINEAESRNMEVEDLGLENRTLSSRVQELEETNDELLNDCASLQNLVDELSAGNTYAEDERDDAVAHYVELMHEIDQKHRAEKSKWEAERKAMQDRLDRYKYRDTMHAIQQEYLLDTLDTTEAARLHMVQEARSLYGELQDQEMIVCEYGDAGTELAEDLQRLLSLSGSTDGRYGDAADVEHLEADIRALAQQSFVEAVQRAQAAQIARVHIEGELQELRYMRAQGHIVESAGEMSAQFKVEVAKLEHDLSNARTDYRDLQALATANRSAFETQLADMQAKVAELQANGGLSRDAKNLEAENLKLTATIAGLTEESAELEARLEAIDYEMDDERTEYERQYAAFDSQNQRLHKVLEQCEVDMAAQVEQINRMRQYIAEVEGERAILAEQSQFQINWLKENYAMAYKDLDIVLNNNGGHTNLKQRIKYVENLKTQILGLKKENFEYSRDCDRLKHTVSLLKSELDAYKEVNDVDAFRARSRVRGQAALNRSKSAGRKTMAPGTAGAADSAAGGQRSTLERRGAAIANKALEDARQLGQQMLVADD